MPPWSHFPTSPAIDNHDHKLYLQQHSAQATVLRIRHTTNLQRVQCQEQMHNHHQPRFDCYRFDNIISKYSGRCNCLWGSGAVLHILSGQRYRMCNILLCSLLLLALDTSAVALWSWKGRILIFTALMWQRATHRPVPWLSSISELINPALAVTN